MPSGEPTVNNVSPSLREVLSPILATPSTPSTSIAKTAISAYSSLPKTLDYKVAPDVLVTITLVAPFIT